MKGALVKVAAPIAPRPYVGEMQGLLELVLEVNDLQRSVAFYRDLLQLPVVDQWPEPRSATWLAIGRNGVLGLWPPASGGEGVAIAGSRGGSHVHFAIYVDRGTLSTWLQRLGDAGHQVEGPVEFAHGNRSLFVSDPDGNIVELADWSVDWAGVEVAPQSRPRKETGRATTRSQPS